MRALWNEPDNRGPGPIRRTSALQICSRLGLAVLPLLSGAFGCATILARPDRVTLICQRRAEDVFCDEYSWWKRGAAWRSELAARHRGKRTAIKYFHVGGHSSKNCVAFDTSSVCGGDARANASAILALEDGGRIEVDATRSETFGLVMGFGSLTGMLLFPWIIWLGVMIGRTTRVRVTVTPTHLDIAKTTAGLFRRSPRVVPRSHDEAVLVSLYSRGGRGDLPAWQITYDTTTREGVRSSEQLLAVKGLVKPAELDEAAERVRAALTRC